MNQEIQTIVNEVLKASRYPDTNKDYLSIAASSHYCNVSENKFRDMVEMYGLERIKFGGRIMYRRSDLQEMLEANIAKN